MVPPSIWKYRSASKRNDGAFFKQQIFERDDNLSVPAMELAL
jgi:hypothetical protein